MTAARGSRSSIVWIGLVLLVALVVAAAFLGQDDDVDVGGFADADGVGREGLLALRLMIEESGGSAELLRGAPEDSHDVAVLGVRSYEIDLGEGDSFGPVMSWVRDGGLLVTGVDTPAGPIAAFASGLDDEVRRGRCSIDRLVGVDMIVAPDNTPIEVDAGDRSCFGDEGRALIVASDVGDGEIVRVSRLEPFFNRSLDEADNGAVAAQVLGIADGVSVAFLEGPDFTAIGGSDGPVDEDGTPIGQGDATLFDLIPSRVIALMVGLALAGLVYAIARSRRLGSPMLEPLPIELPSSDYAEAVGRLYARTDAPEVTSGELLRDDFRRTAARRIGASPDLPADQLSSALALTTSGTDATELTRLLDAPSPTDEAGFVELARALATERNRLEGTTITTRERTTDD